MSKYDVAIVIYTYTPILQGRFARAFARRFCDAAMASARPERPSALGGAGPTGAAFLRATPAFNWAIRSPPPAGLAPPCCPDCC